MASRIAQLAKESKALDTPHLAEAARRTKEYVASIADDPSACPMLPPLGEYTGTDEMFSYVQGYLAGLIVSGGRKPTRDEMDALRYNVINDPVVADMFVRMMKSAKAPPTGPFPSEY